MPPPVKLPPDQSPIEIEGGICPVCGKNIRTELLCCGPCWMRVSQSDKTLVGIAWRKYRDFPTAINFEDMRAKQRKAVAGVLDRMDPLP